MLDDLKFIHQRDGQDALGSAEKQWQQLQHKFEVDLSRINPPKNVVLAGMGGSALGAVFIYSWPGVGLPFEISRDYNLPAYVNEDSLVIVSSYSGNTEETLSSLADAESRNAQIVVLSAGGKLTELANQKNYPLFKVPAVPQPRMSAFYVWNALVQIFEKLNLVSNKAAELSAAGEWLKTQVEAWRADVPTKDNLAKSIAEELAGKSVIVYGGSKMFPAANKWKVWINENAKNLAWAYQYPEFNHNEFIGWSSHPIQKLFAVVDIRSSFEHPRIQKRFELSERLLSGKRPSPIVVQAQGDNLLQQLLWATNLGDFASVYLALLNNVNPTPVDLVERFKLELDK